MVFSSSIFLFSFLPITIFVYYLCNKPVKNIWLLLVSLFFYSWGEPKYIVLMLISILFNYVFGIAMEHVKRRKNKNGAAVLLFVSVAFNLSLLGYFKYANFFVDNLNFITGQNLQIPSIALPIGISFYTFQILSYVVDVYRGNVPAQKNILNLALYISFFPQLIAGPIVRYVDIQEQIQKRTITIDKVYEGARYFVVGFCKKILIADQLSPLVDSIFQMGGGSAPSAWVGAIAYTLQIYFDFSGYSDMAIGLGKIFGFEFMQNFNYPYISKSIQEFWRRWHISLSSWFRDYVYFPLGGSRGPKWKTYRNLIIVFFLTGMWHGASWNFIIWGLYYVIFQIFERIGGKKLLEKLPTALQHLYALLVIVIGWVFFRAETLAQAIQYIIAMFTINQQSWIDCYAMLNKQYIFCLFLGLLFSIPVVQKLKEKFSGRLEFLYDIILIICFIIAISYMVGSGFSPFLYFRF